MRGAAVNFGDPRLPERFWQKVTPCPMTGCWLWMATTMSNGYAQAVLDRKHILVHRWSFVTLVGPVPSGLEIDHICRVRCCVNPLHLRAVTHFENHMNSDSASGRNMRKTHCNRGHEYNEQNTYKHVADNGRTWRQCRTCNRMRMAAIAAKRSLEAKRAA